MNDPDQVLRNYFNMTDQGITAALDRLEVLVETLRKAVPGFIEEHQRQSQKQAERRAEQARQLSGALTDKPDQLIDALRAVLLRRPN